MHGYQIIQELDRAHGRRLAPEPGSVYPTLQQLEDEELVRETASDSGKRVYELTDAGREQAAETHRRPGRPSPARATTPSSRSATSPTRSLAATRQVAQSGSAAQVEAAQTVLRDARKSLYRLLADED